MNISEKSFILIAATTTDFEKAGQVCIAIKDESILFCNWVCENGWYYGVNGNYHYQSLLSGYTQLTPEELYQFYKNENNK